MRGYHKVGINIKELLLLGIVIKLRVRNAAKMYIKLKKHSKLLISTQAYGLCYHQLRKCKSMIKKSRHFTK